MAGDIVLLAPDKTTLEAYRRDAPQGLEIVWADSTQSIENQAVYLQNAEIIIANPSLLSVELARLLPNLKLVQVTSAGTDMMDLTGLSELGVSVANNGGGNAVAVAEHTIALMISVYRKLRLQFRTVQAGEWRGDTKEHWYSQTHELADKTIGIIGLGRIGREVAKRLQGWGCTIVYHDLLDFPAEIEDTLKVTRVSFCKLLKTSDIVTLHVPLNQATEKMISREELGIMKPNAVIVNTCRGGVIDESALIGSLNQGHLAGAGLDVLEEEPTPSRNPLLDMDNVVVTPHLAGFSEEAGHKSRIFAIENVARLARGEAPVSIVSPESI